MYGSKMCVCMHVAVCRGVVWVCGCVCGGVCVCIHRRSWTLIPHLCSKKTGTANRWRPRSYDIDRGCYLTYLCIWGRVLYSRWNTKSTVRRLTVRTVHVWMVNICVCGSTVVGEIFVGQRLSVNTSRCVCVCGGVCVCAMPFLPQVHTCYGFKNMQ